MMLNINYLKSAIDTYQSDAITMDLLTSFKIYSNHYFNIAFKNWGRIIKSYSNTTISLPKKISISYNFKKPTFPLFVILSHKKRLDMEQEISQITLGLKLNNKLRL